MPLIAGLWVALAVAVLSALAPLGPPSSRTTGSAFNPATTAVVLKARSPLASQSAQLTEPERGGLPLLPWSPVCALLPLAVMLAGFWLLRLSTTLPFAPPAGIVLALRSRRRARSPPVC